MSTAIPAAAVRQRPRRKKALWRDPAGRVSALKSCCLALLFVPGLVLAVQWADGMLGPRALTEVIHGTGLWTIRLLFITLAISPAAALLSWPRLQLVRRMAGVACALYGGTHLFLYALDEKLQLLHVASEIVLRFYLTIGFVALLGLAALAITSTDAWVRRLRANWFRLHRLIYLIALLGTVHFFLQSKADVTEAVMMAGLLIWLLSWRILPRRWRDRLVPLPLLAAFATIATALLEATWYHFRNGVDPAMILDTNFDVSFGLRPALWVGIAALGVTIAASGRSLALRRNRPPQRA
jgi:sulfoxide reductase heme-binding subunit YedZ